MKTKKRLTKILVILIAVILIAGLAVFALSEYQYYMDSRENPYVLDVSVDSVGKASYYGPLPAEYAPGQDRQISFTVSNNSYIPVQIREVLLLSVYDQAGTPVFLDGTPYTVSSVELRSENRALTKALEKHQAVYVSEYILDAGKPLYAERSEWESSGNSLCNSNYTLDLAEGSPYANYIFRLDVLLYGKPQAYPYADWSLLTFCSNVLENPDVPATLETSFTANIPMPAFSASQAYHWELDHGKALLVDIGTIQESDIVLPAKIWLSETTDGYVEDPVSGTCYDVKVKGNAFYGNQWLQTVTFQDGVSIANNTMWDDRKQGMFEGCTALTAVNNIPEAVISMEDAFQRCSALRSMPQLPTSVENLTACFYNCSSLQEVSAIPGNVIVANNCFQGCTSLKEIPAFSEGVKDLSGCFYGCTALETIAPLPDSVTTMDGTFINCSSLASVHNFPASLTSLDNCFMNCKSLTQVPVLPEGVKSMVSTFSHCAQLTKVGKLPKSVENMSWCFASCISLQTLPELPEHPAEYSNCFNGCTSLTGTVELPANAMDLTRNYMNLTDMFAGCENISSIVVPCCKNADIADVLTEEIPITLTVKHVTRGTCPGCHYVTDSYTVDGLAVYMDNIPEAIVQELLEFLDNSVPDKLKDTCRKLTFTPNLGKYDSAYRDNIWGGFATWPFGNAYIRMVADVSLLMENPDLPANSFADAAASQVEWAILHELGHCYDYNFSMTARHSGSAEWRRLCNQEGEGYIPQLKEYYHKSQYPEEMFARAVQEYLQYGSITGGPGMEAYIAAIFDEAA